MIRKRGPYRVCRYCGGNLDVGETCDCQKMKDRIYTNIEGAGYRIPMIRYEGDRSRAGQGESGHV